MRYWVQRAVVAPVKRALHFAATLMSTHHDHRRAVAVQLREEVRASGYSDIQVMGNLVRQRSAAAAAAMNAAAAAAPPPQEIKKKAAPPKIIGSASPVKSYWASCIRSRAI